MVGHTKSLIYSGRCPERNIFVCVQLFPNPIQYKENVNSCADFQKIERNVTTEFIRMSFIIWIAIKPCKCFPQLDRKFTAV